MAAWLHGCMAAWLHGSIAPRTVLVAGDSIAGPTLAYWLDRHGLEPTVVERAPELRLGGQNVQRTRRRARRRPPHGHRGTRCEPPEPGSMASPSSTSTLAYLVVHTSVRCATLLVQLHMHLHV